MGVHDGHRKRMRERFRIEGLEGFAPHEVLELLLYYARARGDVNPLAHALMDAFGSLKGVLEASTDQLMSVEGIGEESATLISLMLPLFRRYSASVCQESPQLYNRGQAKDYCRSLLAGWRRERLYLICLNADRRVIAQRLITEGTLSEVPAYPRLIVETALNYNAESVLLCHNHPGGSLKPSRADIISTQHLIDVLQGLEIRLLDHIIVAGEETYSMQQHGDFDLDVMDMGMDAGRAAEDVDSLLPRKMHGAP